MRIRIKYYFWLFVLSLVFVSGGYTQWSQQNSGTINTLQTVFFVNNNTGWCAGGSGTILKTTNSGDTWSPVNGLPNRNYTALSFYGNFGWVAGDIGSILRSTNHGGTLGITQTGNELPEAFSLSQNHPNPFNPVTNIEFEINYPGLVRLKIYDILDRKATTLIENELKAGKHKAEWTAVDHPSGIYFYRLAQDL